MRTAPLLQRTGVASWQLSSPPKLISAVQPNQPSPGRKGGGPVRGPPLHLLWPTRPAAAAPWARRCQSSSFQRRADGGRRPSGAAGGRRAGRGLGGGRGYRPGRPVVAEVAVGEGWGRAGRAAGTRRLFSSATGSAAAGAGRSTTGIRGFVSTAKVAVLISSSRSSSAFSDLLAVAVAVGLQHELSEHRWRRPLVARPWRLRHAAARLRGIAVSGGGAGLVSRAHAELRQ